MTRKLGLSGRHYYYFSNYHLGIALGLVSIKSRIYKNPSKNWIIQNINPMIMICADTLKSIRSAYAYLLFFSELVSYGTNEDNEPRLDALGKTTRTSDR